MRRWERDTGFSFLKRKIIEFIMRKLGIKQNKDTFRDPKTIRVPYPEESMWIERDAMVGTLRNTHQLDVCLEHKFYHIPAKYISEDNFPIKFIAIYQSKNLFGKEAGIRWWGEVESVSCVRRNTIKEIPKDSREYYYVFKVKRWDKLPNLIHAKEMAYIRLFVNSEMLLNSTEFPQLTMRNKFEHNIYKTLIDRIIKLEKDPFMEFEPIEWGVCNLTIDQDELQLRKGEKLLKVYALYDFIDIPVALITCIRRDVDNALK